MKRCDRSLVPNTTFVDVPNTVYIHVVALTQRRKRHGFRNVDIGSLTLNLHILETLATFRADLMKMSSESPRVCF